MEGERRVRGAWRRRARHWIANRGWRALLLELWRRWRLRMRGERRGDMPGSDAVEDMEAGLHPFDERYGVETGGLIWGEALAADVRVGASGERGNGQETSQETAYWVTGYYGVAPSVLWPALEQLGLAWEQTTFVDVGCGKGRAMLLATKYPFLRVMGVELSTELAAVAERNVGRFRAEWRQSGVSTEVVCGDATRVPLPAGPLLLFLYHPFAAPVMTRFLQHVRDAVRAERREVVLLYMNPELDGLLARVEFLERLWDACFALSAEDRAADRFGSEWERMVAYRVRLERV